MLTNYVLIDHVGSVEDFQKLYQLTYKKAAQTGFINKKSESKKVWTMKQICQTMSPYAQQITDKMKYHVRYNKHPMMVYLVCPTIDSSSVDFIKTIWEERDIPVAIVSEKEGFIDPETPKTYDFGLELSIYRRCALIWSKALGWEFSAPLIHEQRIVTADPWMKRQEYNEIVDIQNGEIITRADLLGNHITKISTNPEKFQDAFHTIASEDECKAFFEHYKYLWENKLIADFLEPDWTLCPTCGRPIRIGTAETITCDYCDTEIHSEVFETYYDDSYEIMDEQE